MSEVRPPAPAGPLQGGTLDQFMPVGLFIVLYNLVGTEAAVLASTGWSVKAGYSRRRRGLPIGAWLPLITGYLIARAAVTIAVERELVDFGVSSEAVYFGIGIGTKILIGLVVAGTILAGRPLLVWLVPMLVRLEPRVVEHPRYRQVMTNTTWLIVAYELLSSVWDIWLFNNSGVNLFIVTRQVVNFVVAFGLITAALMYIDTRLKSIEGYPGLVEVLESSGRVKG